MKKSLLVVMGLLMTSFGYAQSNNIWKKTDYKKSLNVIPTKSDLPTKTLFQLDIDAFRNLLEGAPSRAKSHSSSIIIDIPNANGVLESYRIFETPLLQGELLAKYPNIKSYAGQGIDDPTSRIRFSMAPTTGLQSMRFSASGAAVFIEPINNDATTYTIYKRSEKSATVKRFECLVEENASGFDDQSSVQHKNADDSTLRTFRLAVSTTGEYTQFHGGTVAGALAAINATMTRVNGVFENDFGVTMVLIPNNDVLIYTNANSDPYSNGNFNSQVQSVLTRDIGESAYDVGHLFARASDNGNAGCIGCVCSNGRKGSAFTSRSTPQGDPFDIDYVAHELGHQFGGNHTFTHRNEGTVAQVEPGSGSTIMGYAGITGATDVQPNSDPYFHAATIEQITNYVKSTSCQTNTNTGNAVPTANAGTNYTIPSGTPFVLTGQGSDANSADVLTYCWEQMDGRVGTNPSVNATSGVAFRSYNPTVSNKRYFPRLSTIKNGATSWQWEAVPNVTRSLKFRLTVRDNKAGGAANNSDDMVVNVRNGAGPFVVNSPNTNVTWAAGSSQTVTWDVAGTTGNGVNTANVDIYLSTDGGDTYPIALATGVANDGSHSITVPNNQGSQNRIMVKGSGNIFFDISNTNFTIDGQVVPDTQAPTAPTGLIASNETQSTIDLSWNASTDDTAVTAYDVYNGNTVIATVATTSYTVTGLSADTPYTFRARAKDAAGNVSGFSATLTASTIGGGGNPPGGNGCTNGIASFPYGESFENNLGAWSQATDDDINWTRDSGGTPSRNTGPSNGAQGSFYMYIEASGNNAGYPNKRAILNSPCFDLSGTDAATFSFQYHMYGSSIGTIALEASNDNGTTWTSLWSESGNQGNSWNAQSIDLTSYAGASVQLRFNGITSTSWSGDISIDDVRLTTGSTPPPASCTDVTLTLRLDNYPEETSWQITNSSNQVVASGGTYGSSPDGSTVSVTECLDAGTYTFTINDTYGDGICCSFGNGSYSLVAGTTSLASGGSFGRTESTTFTIGGSTARGPEVINFVTTKAISSFSIFPNPTNGILNISSAKAVSDMTYTVQDLLGRIVSEGKVYNNAINMNAFEGGLYLVSIHTQGILSFTHKITKE